MHLWTYGFILWLRLVRRWILNCYFGLKPFLLPSSWTPSEDSLAGKRKDNLRCLSSISGVDYPVSVAGNCNQTALLGGDVHARFWSLLTARLKLLPSLPVCLFLSAPSSSPSSCLCSRNAPSWAATSQGQGSLWGRSFWAVCLKRWSGGIIKR